ncbi:hypothetical protein SDC9_151887 [bioreactor metagenome]|uniref:Uncharacterized protein n=1 Tax=bioreactor metagenome TaxID=1076179 RepID=A0A645ETU5_9ZZZZ
MLRFIQRFDHFPVGSRHDARRVLKRQLVLSDEHIKQVRHDLSIGHEAALVAEHFDIAAVCVIRGDLAVVHDREVEHRERMRAAPPARRVRREAAVRGPKIPLVGIELEKVADVLGVADALKSAHVFAAGENVRAVNIAVDVHHNAGGVFVLVNLRQLQPAPFGLDEVAPDDRRGRH